MSDPSRTTPPLPWEEPGWRAEVDAWIAARLAEHGIPASGDAEVVKMRAWSCVLRVPTTTGRAYFKAPAPSMAHEVPLTAGLASWQPERSPVMLGVDQRRGWMLFADGGPILREFVADARYGALCERAVAEYAELQLALVPHVAEIVAFGVPDRRLARMPALLAEALADERALRVDLQDGLTAEEVHSLHGLLPTLERECAALAAFGLPESVDHSDLHDGNIFAAGERFRFFDWGDAGVAHPFLSLTVMLRMFAHQLGHDYTRPLEVAEVRRLRDAYLEPWTRMAGRGQLLEASAIAYRVGMLPRAFTWRDVLAAGEEWLEPDHLSALPAWLREWLEQPH